MSTRFNIALLLYGMANAVLFGIGTITVLAVPSLAENATILIPAVVVASLIFAAPIAWWVAPRLRARFWRRREGEGADHPVARA